jgi:anti-sigma factor RsiW
MTTTELTCREVIDFLADYLEGTLRADQRAPFEAHLAECADCVAYLRSYRETIRLAQEACRGPDDPVPADVPEELVRAIAKARGTPARGPRRPARRRG